MTTFAEKLFARFSSSDTEDICDSEEWVMIDEPPMYTALVREAAFTLLSEDRESLCCLVDAETASHVESLANIADRAAWCCVFGEMPESWQSVSTRGLIVQAPAIESAERFFIALGEDTAAALVLNASESDLASDLTAEGAWTASRRQVEALAERFLQGAGMDPPPVPASVPTDSPTTLTMRLMRRFVELYNARQLHVLSDRNDLSAVLEILKTLSIRQDPHAIMYGFVDQIARRIGIDRCSVVRPDVNEGTVRVLASHEDQAVQNLDLDLEKYPEIKHAASTGEKVIINDVSAHPLVAEQRDALSKAGFTAILVVPVVVNDPLVGTLLMRALRRAGGFTSREISFFEIVAEAGAIAVERVELFDSLQKTNHELAHLAATDALTGLYNRRYFTRRFEAEYSRALRYDLPLSCMMIDIDNFKSLNDTYGHLAGDEVLREIAERMLTSTRAHDIVARYGGEEFVAVLPQTGRIGAATQGERLLTRIASQPFRGLPDDVRVTVSVGLAVLDSSKKEPLEMLLQRADNALFAAKRGGKNRMVIADDSNDSK